jgi:hypothetical protein
MTPQATPSDPNQARASQSPEEFLKQAWGRYGFAFYVLCGAVAVGILAKGGLDYLNVQKELGIQKDFSACVSNDSFRDFAAAHPGHPLTGVAELTVADNLYSAGKYSDAVSVYSSAVADLPKVPVLGRAKLGLAMSQALAGKTADAEVGLRLLLNDAGQLKTIRCEAGYHLAGIAVAAGRGADVQAIAEQVMRIDATSPFAERTFSLRPPGSGSVTVPGAPIPAASKKP